MEKLIELLHDEHCSLVLKDKAGSVHLFYKKGVRDLSHTFKSSPALLRQACIADKVVGKAAAAYMALGGIARVYADVMSRKALPVLSAAGIPFTYGELVGGIVIPENDTRCRLEELVADTDSPQEIVEILESHFEAMRLKG